MKKKIAILGSTGSIGKTTFNILKKDKKNFDVLLLTTNNNYKEILKQAKEFKVKNLVINNKNHYLNLTMLPIIFPTKNNLLQFYHLFQKVVLIDLQNFLV